jgi:hypothetical protein
MVTTLGDLHLVFAESADGALDWIRCRFRVLVNDVCLVTRISTILKTPYIERIFADCLLRS